jgi:hypothetical protein
MTDTTEAAASPVAVLTSDPLARYQDACRQRVHESLPQIAAALAAAGVASVTALYEGSADSGQIEEFSYWDANNQLVDEKVLGETHDQVAQILYDLVEIRHGGYENNEGGGGEFRWDLTEAGLVHEHWDYIIERDYTTYEGLGS